MKARFGLEDQPLLDVIGAVLELLDRFFHPVGVEVGQEAEPADVDPRDGRFAVAEGVRGAQERPVAAVGEHHVAGGGEVAGRVLRADGLAHQLALAQALGHVLVQAKGQVLAHQPGHQFGHRLPDLFFVWIAGNSVAHTAADLGKCDLASVAVVNNVRGGDVCVQRDS